jgi:transcription elongation factor GreA
MDYLSSVAIAPKAPPVAQATGGVFFCIGRFPQEYSGDSNMSSIPISKEGFQALEQELDRLKKERPHVIQAIKEAREEGDLKENAGYDAARERQGMLEARIKYIESRMALFNVIDLSTLSSEKAIFGATVTVEDADTGEEREFTLLGPDEADYAKGTISIQSPVGVALLGKEVGDEITVNAPRGRINYEIIDIQFKKKTA